MTREEAKSCIGTIELLQRLAYNIHGVMDVIDAANCKKIVKALEQEPCEDCISRVEALKIIDDINIPEDMSIFEIKSHIGVGIFTLPPATFTQKKGKWKIKATGFPPEPMTVCSECGFDRDFYIRARGFDKINYCPNCGAKMESEG